METYRHQERMRRFNLAYKKLKTDKAAWEEEQDCQDLEGTVADGLED